MEAGRRAPSLVTSCATSSCPLAWLHGAGPAKFARAVDVVRTLDPEWIMPSLGTPMHTRTAELCDHLAAPPARERFAFTNDAAFRIMLEAMKRHGELAAV